MILPNNYKEEYYNALVNCLNYVKSGDSICAVVAIAGYEAWEERIISALGDEGEKIVLSVKGKAVEHERELGISFFAEQVENLRDHRRVRELYPSPFEFNPPRKTCDLDERLLLADSEGEVLEYHHIAVVIFEGDMYLEIVYPEEIKTRRRLAYYRVEQKSSRIILRLVEDEGLHSKLSKITDNLL